MLLQAFDNLYYLERAAEVTVKARSMHMELEVIGSEVRPNVLGPLSWAYA